MNKCSLALQTSMLFDEQEDFQGHNFDELGPWFKLKEKKQLIVPLQPIRVPQVKIKNQQLQKRVYQIKTERYNTERTMHMNENPFYINKIKQNQEYTDSSPVEQIIKKHFSNKQTVFFPKSQQTSFVQKSDKSNRQIRVKKLKIYHSDIPLLNQYNYFSRLL
ncbi:unnamed protein product (macronuclear) [Paramecium tetraurelia]|uniref:Uncharacterized protein n=1 Tax=Paramecium tetraurelia TaxID=5888 RepID=A0DHC3_PARTE|nr:uncharacterized protein GSPATT00016827001 [Paramecium tetraurelia]CAK82440.1 unnamed protein product [Paramecium tetraurelia]|eukprot:XP_001449837.1 hypothetical protein (macronuclear) [Paramecium tetraurelia strain d4-2]